MYDLEGVVVHKVPYTKQYRYNATDVAVQALNKNPAAIDWLQRNMQGDGSFPHLYSVPYYNLKPGWTSGVSQALAALAFKQWDMPVHADKAIRYMINEHMYSDIILEKGGMLILNGWLYGMVALKAMKCDKLYHATLLELKKNLPSFIMRKHWSRYDATGIPATKFYHNVHIDLLRELNFPHVARELELAEYPKLTRLFYIAKKNNIRLPLVYMKQRQWRNRL